MVILATPNGWDVAQQGFLREAAMEAGLVTQANAEERVEFVTEGEAAVHYVLAYQKHDWLEAGPQFIVVDAGGSTVDSTLYECKAVKPHVTYVKCVQANAFRFVLLSRSRSSTTDCSCRPEACSLTRRPESCCRPSLQVLVSLTKNA